MPSRFLGLLAGSTLLRAQAIRGIATPMRGTITARSRVQLAVTAAGPLRISYPASARVLIPRVNILRAFSTFSDKDIPPCGKQCTCNYETEKESMIRLQRWTILCFAGAAMAFAGILFTDLVKSFNITIIEPKKTQSTGGSKSVTETGATTL